MIKSFRVLQGAFNILLNKTPLLNNLELKNFVQELLRKRKIFISAFKLYSSPLYLIEQQVLLDRAHQFFDVFNKKIPDLQVYYAIKSNNHPMIVKTFVDFGFGLDVSSGKELLLALECGATNIVFSGPGKTEQELEIAIKNQKYVTVLMDSYSELERLNNIALRAGVLIRTGVRLITDEKVPWSKFGISLSNIPDFIVEVKKHRNIQLQGLQFHTSWNLNPENYVTFIRKIGNTLKRVDREDLEKLQFIDIGGGYWPPQGEWLQLEGTPEGKLCSLILPSSKSGVFHYKLKAVTIEEFANQIAKAFKKYIFPLVKCKIYAEPGRWLCNDAMHIILRVIDKKGENLVITDAGTNAIGWERFETDYFPVINLSRPSLKERKCYILGSLCTPHDVWGYSYHGEEIQKGDVLLIPYQGAYTYSLRQEFIKPLPKVVFYTSSGEFKECSYNNLNI